MGKRQFLEIAVRYALRIAASTSILIVVLIFLFLFKEAFPFIHKPGLGALLGSSWAPTSMQEVEFGIYPLVVGSLSVTVLAMLFAIPFGICGAVYIAEVAESWEREILKPFVELIAAIPSVVLGFFGVVVLGPIVMKLFHLDTGKTALTGALLLAFMAIPTIITISEDAIRSVPMAYKEASMALGASRFQTMWKVTVPAAMSGIIASIMLGMGRVIGETMAVLMVTGNAPVITLSPTSRVRTMTATIAGELGEVVYGSTHYQALFWIGVVLLLATFMLNLVAQRVLKTYRRP